MRKLSKILLASVLLVAGLQAGAARAQKGVSISEFTIDKDALCEVRDQWLNEIAAENEPGTWASLKFEPTNAQLDKLGLPSREILRAQRYPVPTLVTKDGQTFEVPMSELQAAFDATNDPTLATFGGAGCLGIRPGALLLTITDEVIGWCSMAHMYGTEISTAGHCGNTGDVGTVIAATGNRGDATGVILLDFGRYTRSTGDGGLGRDWATIGIDSAYQSLSTPTMCFWGGPRGTYQKDGEVVGLDFPGNSLIPSVSATPDPTLAQTIVHYGHGTGVGAGGTPRVAEAIAWLPDHFMFFGAITPGDSGSGANTSLGDTIGANMQAAGIITHIWVDALMRDGIGIMGGTRAKLVGTATNGQIVPYPAPVPGLP